MPESQRLGSPRPVRYMAEDSARIFRASQIAETSVAGFIRDASLERARQVLEGQGGDSSARPGV